MTKVWKKESWSRMPAPFSQESRTSNFCHHYYPWGPKSRKVFFLRPGVPLISGSGWTPPPPPPLSQGLHPPLSRILFSFPIPNLYPNFGESRFPGSSQIPYPVKESRIPKILPDPEEKSRSRFFGNFCKCLTEVSEREFKYSPRLMRGLKNHQHHCRNELIQFIAC